MGKTKVKIVDGVIGGCYIDKVEFQHFIGRKNWIIPGGGVTACMVTADRYSDRVFAFGFAFCSPVENGFSKKLGRTIARGRAEKILLKESGCIVAQGCAEEKTSCMSRVVPDKPPPHTWFHIEPGEPRDVDMNSRLINVLPAVVVPRWFLRHRMTLVYYLKYKSGDVNLEILKKVFGDAFRAFGERLSPPFKL